jgi:hypothetical protein
MGIGNQLHGGLFALEEPQDEIATTPGLHRSMATGQWRNCWPCCGGCSDAPGA